MPILQQWKSQYNFVGSYYIDIGANPPDQQTIWAQSGVYYKQLLGMGNELGSHSVTHPENTNTLTAAQFQSEFQGSKQIIEQQMSQFLGHPFTVTGAAVPGASETLATALSIIQYYDYLSGGFSGVGAGFPGAIGYLNPAMAAQDKVYLAPNVQFDFTLVEFKGMTPAQASVEWQREWNELTKHGDVPILLWPWHDYAGAAWATNPPATSPYTTAMFTQFISQAAAAGAEFVTLADLADRVSAFNDTSITTSVSGNTVTASVTSPSAGKFSLDLDNLVGTQKIASVNGWYAYDNDSVFLDRDGGSFTINLGNTAADVTHITSLPMRAELVSLSGNGTNLTFSVVGEGRLVIDLANPAGRQPTVTGASVVSLAGEILTLDLGAVGTHNVSVTLAASAHKQYDVDLNGDGRSDMLWQNSGGVLAWQVNGSLVSSQATLVGGANWRVLDSYGDYQGDGKTDILWRAADGTLVLWAMNGTQVTSTTVGTTPAGWIMIDAHGDYNGDGKSDLLWQYSDSALQFWEMDGARVARVTTLGSMAPGWSIVSAHSDFDGDGKSDILWRHTGGTLMTWQMNGGQIVASTNYGVVPTELTIIDGTGDYNGDGRSDVLYRHVDGSVVISLMNGSQPGTTTRLGPVPTSWTIVDGHGDYNGDGKSDILWRHTDGWVIVWQMDGGQITADPNFGAVPPSWTITDGHSDFDGDGKSDILWRHTDGWLIAWQMNGALRNPDSNFGLVPTSSVMVTEVGATLTGESAGNTLVGTVMSDTLHGLFGADTLTGGPGADRFVFETALSATTNVDTITDFTSGTDTLVLQDLIFANVPRGTLAAAGFVSSAAPVAADANDRILYNTTTGAVSYDADGSAAAPAMVFAMLSNHPALTAQDIYVGPF
jgi:peptidoglycan/xylan/chitin deacetylase (PgdA/CDA1 family)